MNAEKMEIVKAFIIGYPLIEALYPDGFDIPSNLAEDIKVHKVVISRWIKRLEANGMLIRRRRVYGKYLPRIRKCVMLTPRTKKIYEVLANI